MLPNPSDSIIWDEIATRTIGVKSNQWATTFNVYDYPQFHDAIGCLAGPGNPGDPGPPPGTVNTWQLGKYKVDLILGDGTIADTELTGILHDCPFGHF